MMASLSCRGTSVSDRWYVTRESNPPLRTAHTTQYWALELHCRALTSHTRIKPSTAHYTGLAALRCTKLERTLHLTALHYEKTALHCISLHCTMRIQGVGLFSAQVLVETKMIPLKCFQLISAAFYLKKWEEEIAVGAQKGSGRCHLGKIRIG